MTYHWLCFHTASYSVKIFTFADDLSRLQKSIIFVQKKKHGVQIDMTSTDTETLWKLAEISKSAMKSQYHHVKHIPVTRQKFWQDTKTFYKTAKYQYSCMQRLLKIAKQLCPLHSCVRWWLLEETVKFVWQWIGMFSDALCIFNKNIANNNIYLFSEQRFQQVKLSLSWSLLSIVVYSKLS